MIQLLHTTLSPSSRFIRLLLSESGLGAECLEYMPWDRNENLLIVNPAATLPVMIEDGVPPVCGAVVIAEYLDETRGPMLRERRLVPDSPLTRAEMRRVVNWYLEKMDHEVIRYFATEKAYKRLEPSQFGSPSPDTARLRQARNNLRIHMTYTGYLLSQQDWISHSRITFADFAAAATLSVADYLGEISWDEYPLVRDWYARLKSRPSFRPILADKVKGIPPSVSYIDLDF